MKSNFLPLAILCIVAPTHIFATNIVIIAEKSRIVVACDSLVKMGGSEPPRHKCKIRQNGDVFWTAIGVDFDEETGYTVDAIFNEVQKSKLSFRTALDLVGNKLQDPLQVEWERFKAVRSPDYWRMKRAGIILTLFVVTNRGGVLRAYSKDMGIDNDKIVPRAASPCVQCVMVSDFTQLSYVNSHKDLFIGSKVTVGIDELMKMETASYPEDVGPPFSILELNTGGAKWLRQNDCANLEVQSTHRKPQKSRADSVPQIH